MIAGAPQGLIWLDGRWRPRAAAVTHVMTYTLHYGLGAFEGVRAYQGHDGVHLFRLRDHTRRLFGVDRRRIGDGTPGHVTRALQARYFAAVRGEVHPEWRTRPDASVLTPDVEEVLP